MPKLVCPCGYVHNLSSIPDHGWHTGSDSEWEEIVKLEFGEIFEGAESGAISMLGLLYECPDCGRIMWRKPGEKVFTIYQRDS